MKLLMVRYCCVALALGVLSLSHAAQAQAPVISSINPNTYTGGGQQILISGTGFGNSQGTSTITLNGVIVGAIDWSSTAIIIIPSGYTSGNLVVTTSAGASNPVFLQISTPTLNSISPASGPPGTAITFNGSNLQGCVEVFFYGSGGSSFATTTVNSPSSLTVIAPNLTGTSNFWAVCGGAQIYWTPTFTYTTLPPVDPGLQANRIISPSFPPSLLSNTDLGMNQFFSGGITKFKSTMMPSNGLGPRYNGSSCNMCHAQPAIGGSSPCTTQANCATAGSEGFVLQSELVAENLAPGNATPSFLTSTGPTLEARFVYLMTSGGTINTSAPSGSVEDIFTVHSSTCNLPQPAFSAAISANNIVYRLPIAVYGDGLIENIDDSSLLQNMQLSVGNSFGISGSFNHSADDGTISRFGWKAQSKSLQQFSGAAFNVEIGITNLLFPNEHYNPEDTLPPAPGQPTGTGLPSGCMNPAGYPEDYASNILSSSESEAFLDTVSQAANWMRFLAPPPPGPVILNTVNQSSTLTVGATYFKAIGCQTCHSQSPGTTQQSSLDIGLSGVKPQPYSDFEIHHMGSGLADNVTQGNAGGDQFRTAPLWGLGNRYFLMHDGRDTDLLSAIAAHSSNGSEATTSVTNFNNLASTPGAQQAVLNFLRSL